MDDIWDDYNEAAVTHAKSDTRTYADLEGCHIIGTITGVKKVNYEWLKLRDVKIRHRDDTVENVVGTLSIMIVATLASEEGVGPVVGKEGKRLRYDMGTTVGIRVPIGKTKSRDGKFSYRAVEMFPINAKAQVKTDAESTPSEFEV